MIVGTVLKDSRNNVEGVLYGDDGENAIVFGKQWINQQYCEVVKIPWRYLTPTSEIIPISAIPSRYISQKTV